MVCCHNIVPCTIDSLKCAGLSEFAVGLSGFGIENIVTVVTAVVSGFGATSFTVNTSDFQVLFYIQEFTTVATPNSRVLQFSLF